MLYVLAVLFLFCMLAFRSFFTYLLSLFFFAVWMLRLFLVRPLSHLFITRQTLYLLVVHALLLVRLRSGCERFLVMLEEWALILYVIHVSFTCRRRSYNCPSLAYIRPVTRLLSRTVGWPDLEEPNSVTE